MRLAKRLFAVVGIPAVLAGLFLAGSASGTPSIQAGSKLATVTFTATVITGTSTYTVNSTACSLKEPGKTAVTCFLSGSGSLNANGKIVTANLAVTSAKGPITLNLTDLNVCGVGSGVAIVGSKGTPTPVVALTDRWVTGNTIMGTLDIFDVGTTTKTCAPPA